MVQFTTKTEETAQNANQNVRSVSYHAASIQDYVTPQDKHSEEMQTLLDENP